MVQDANILLNVFKDNRSPVSVKHSGLYADMGLGRFSPEGVK